MSVKILPSLSRLFLFITFLSFVTSIHGKPNPYVSKEAKNPLTNNYYLKKSKTVGKLSAPFIKRTQKQHYDLSLQKEIKKPTKQESRIRLIRKADSLREKKEYEQADALYEKVYQSSLDTPDSIRYDMGCIYINFLKLSSKNYEKAWEVNTTLYENFSHSDYKEGIIQCTIEYGTLADLMDRPSQALSYYNKAIELLENTGNEYSEYKFRALNNRAILMETKFSGEDIENIQELILKDRREALNYLTKDNTYRQRALAFINLSQSYRQKNLDSTIYYNEQALKYAQKSAIRKRLSRIIYNNIADAYMLKNQPHKALEVLHNIDFVGSKEEVNGYAFGTAGEVYIALGQYEKALEFLKVSEKKLIEVKDWPTAKYIVELLSDVFLKKGNPEAAIAELKKIPAFLKSSYNERLDEKISELKIQFELREKEKEVAVLKEEKETISIRMNKIQLISYLLGALLLIGVLIYVNRASINKAKFYKLNEKVNHNRLLSLQSAMNPHFLFNSFGTLQHFILKKEIKKANSYMTTLSDLIRNVFASSNSIYIRFNNEIAILKSYIELELGRFDHSFEVVFDIPQELTNNNPMIPSMILQPYVENAIIHGFSEKEGAKKLTLTFTRINAKSVQCEITDNGVGRKKVEKIQKDSKLKNKKNLSIATKNTQERLQIINKKDDQEGTIAIQDLYDNNRKASGTKVIIALPIAENNVN